MTWGFFRPVVFLPSEARQWEPGLRESVLKHELAHCERNDCWWLLLARVIASVFWFQPLAWWAVYRISAECERAADDAVLRTGVSAGEYANWLITIAREMRGEPAAALAMGRSSEFEGRLKAVLDERVNRRSFSRAGALALAAAACVVLLPLAAAQTTKGQKTDSDDRVYKMDDGISPPSLIFKVEPQYTEAARDAKLMGTVHLTVRIEKDGSPQNITVVEGLPMGLDEKAVEAIKQWKFKPGMKDGRPVRVLANIEVNFRLN
jgi:TonB family protein